MLAAAVLFCAAALPAAAAVVKNTAFFCDFDTNESGNVLGELLYETNTFQGSADKKMVLTPSEDKTAGVNIYAYDEQGTNNVVVGFDIYSSTTTDWHIGIGQDGNTVKWEQLTGKGTTLTLQVTGNTANPQATLNNGWNHMCMAIDYDADKMAVWLNGTQVGTQSIWFTKLQRVKISARAKTDPVAFDNVYVYYPATEEVTAADTVNVKESSYKVNMGQRVFGDVSKVTVKQGDTTVVTGAALSENKYQNELTFDIAEKLTAGQTYTVSFNGLTDAFGTAIEDVTFQAVKDGVITAVTESETKGSASLTTTAANKANGKETAFAVAKEGYLFEKWTTADRELTEEEAKKNPLTVDIGTKDATLTATFTDAATPVEYYYDFEDGKLTNNSAVVSVNKMALQDASGDNTGKSLAETKEVNVKSYAELNMYPKPGWNNVVGFSLYNGTGNGFSFISVAYRAGSSWWSEPSSLSGFIKLDGGNLKIGNDEFPLKEGWSEVYFGMDYQTHTVSVWLNGVKQTTTYTLPEQVQNTARFKFEGTNAGNGFEIDNLAMYSPAKMPEPTGETALSWKSTSYEVNLGQKMFGDVKNSVKIYKDGSSVNVAGEGTVTTDKNVDSVTVPLTALEGNTTYRVEISGITDALGKKIEKTWTFTTSDSTPKLVLSTDETRTLPEGTVVDVKIATENMESTDFVEIYQNDKVIRTVAADTESVSVTLAKGTNKVYAKMVGKDIYSATIELLTKAYEVVPSTCDLDNDFESPNTVATGFYMARGNAGVCELYDVGGTHGKVARLAIEVQDMTGKDRPVLNPPTAKDVNGVIVLEGDFYFVTEQNATIFTMKNGKGGWFTGFGVSGTTLNVGGNKVKDIELGKWYHLKIMFDTVNDTYSAFVDGRVCVWQKNLQISQNDGLQYATVHTGNPDVTNGLRREMYVDNMKQYVLGEPYTYSVSAVDATGAATDKMSYQDAKVKVTFSQAMNEETLSGITVSDAGGQTVTQTGAVYDAATCSYTISLGTVWSNAAYTVTIPNTVKTAVGAGGATGTVTLMSDKEALAIGDVATSVTSGTCSVTATLQADAANPKTVSVAICVYEGDCLKSKTITQVNTAESLTANGSFAVPSGKYTVEVYLLENFTTMKCIDIFVK